MGGEILGFREPTEEEYEFHQDEMRKRDEGQMNSREERKIIQWRRIPEWKEAWPSEARSHQMAYRAYGYVAPRNAP